MRRLLRVPSTTWIVLAAGLAAVALVVATILATVAYTRTQDLLVRQQQGRRAAVTATCSAIGAVIDAGRATILSGATIRPREFERNLEDIGLPARTARRQGARDAARAYSEAIASRIAAQTGERGIVNPDGTLNCARLRAISRAG